MSFSLNSSWWLNDDEYVRKCPREVDLWSVTPQPSPLAFACFLRGYGSLNPPHPQLGCRCLRWVDVFFWETGSPPTQWRALTVEHVSGSDKSPLPPSQPPGHGDVSSPEGAQFLPCYVSCLTHWCGNYGFYCWHWGYKRWMVCLPTKTVSPQGVPPPLILGPLMAAKKKAL